MLERKITYYIVEWLWDYYISSYEPITIYSTEDEKLARDKYNSIEVNPECPKISLYRRGYNRAEKLATKESKTLLGEPVWET